MYSDQKSKELCGISNVRGKTEKPVNMQNKRDEEERGWRKQKNCNFIEVKQF